MTMIRQTSKTAISTDLQPKSEYRGKLSNANISHVLFNTGLLVLCLSSLLNSTSIIEGSENALRVFSIACLMVCLLLNVNKLKVTLPILLILGTTLIAIMLHGFSALNLVAVIIYGMCCSVIQSEQVYKSLIVTLFLSLLLYFGLLITGGLHWEVNNYLGRVRNNLGFYHVNAASLFFAALGIIPVILKRKKAAGMVFFIVACMIIYSLTNTRSILMFAFLYGIIVFLFSISEKKSKKVNFPLIISLIILYSTLLFSIVLPLLDIKWLDYLLSNRLSLFQEAINSLGLMGFFFGSNKTSEVDNSFITILSTYGLLTLIIVVAMFHRAIIGLAYKRDWYSLAFVCAMILLGSIESILYRPEFLISLFFWALVLQSQDFDGARNHPSNHWRQRSNREI